MKNLKSVFVLSILFFGLSLNAQIQPSPNTIVQYGDESGLHSRALTSFRKTLYIAASDGKLYVHNSKDNTLSVSSKNDVAEYRDVIVNRKNILLLASGDSSATLAKPRKIGKERFIGFDGQFLDGIAYSKKTVFMMGDPIDGKFNLFFSDNFGWSWKKVENPPLAAEGEAGFAASGTNVRMLSDKEWLFVSGGMESKLYRTDDAGVSWTESSMGFKSCASCGAYSIAILPNNTIVAVGGDYTKPQEQIGTCRISNDEGITWHSPKVNLNGYRSNVIFHKGKLYACGSNGIDVSQDFGDTWKPFTYGNYFTMTFFGKQLVASTVNGTVHLFNINQKKK